MLIDTANTFSLLSLLLSPFKGTDTTSICVLFYFLLKEKKKDLNISHGRIPRPQYSWIRGPGEKWNLFH